VLVKTRRFVPIRPLVIQPARWRQPYQYRKPKLLPRRSKPRRIASLVLLASGALLCAYVAGSYTWMYAEQKRLLHQWKTQQASGDSLPKLSIPRIGLRAVVLEGASGHALLLGPAHLTGSALPGTLGNTVIAGHRDTFFRHVHSLRYGDNIYISQGKKQFHYVVVRRKVVEPTDLSVLHPSKDGELTLITCYPTHVIGPAPQRLIIVAKLVAGS
jgi:LPXTG-site transpeptidase (sortase) family protein